MHPSLIVVLPSDPPFRIDLQAARSYANLLAQSQCGSGAALSTLAPGLQRLTVIHGSQPERASSNALWAPPARAVIVGRKNCDLRAHTVSLSQEFLVEVYATCTKVCRTYMHVPNRTTHLVVAWG